MLIPRPRLVPRLRARRRWLMCSAVYNVRRMPWLLEPLRTAWS